MPRPYPTKETSAGQPYQPQYAVIARKLCEFGATVADLAEAFSVSPRIIEDWRKTHTAFAEALLTETVHQQLDRVEEALYRRATGYEYIAEKLVTYKGRAKREKYRAHVLPDVSAAQFVLLNHRPEKWRLPAGVEPAPEDNSGLIAIARALNNTVKWPREY